MADEVLRPAPFEWKIDGAGNSQLTFRAIPPGWPHPSAPFLNISVDYERETMFGANYLNAGHIDLRGDAATRFARELSRGQAVAKGVYWDLVVDNTEPYQFILYRTPTRQRAVRRFQVGLLSMIPLMADDLIKVLQWAPPITRPKPHIDLTPMPPRPNPTIHLNPIKGAPAGAPIPPFPSH